ncbi:MAG TPA: DUF2065 domain-containing protein [Gammaproteobacteria bacterium]|nr:DUF2065 domain-containing protein [Gammaproteobacteria bacterium]
MWENLLPALALVLVIEGILPFLSPKGWREAVQQASRLSDNALRMVGFSSMLLGVIILYFVR